MIETEHNSTKEVNFHELLSALWYHKILITLVCLTCIFIGGITALKTERTYTAKAIFNIDSGKKNSSLNLTGELGSLATIVGLSEQTDVSKLLLERLSSREFILLARDQLELLKDPFFNTYQPQQTKTEDPLWKSVIKQLIGWKSQERSQDQIIERKLIQNFNRNVETNFTVGGATVISVTHTNPEKAATYANQLMSIVKQLIEKENKESADRRLNYLSQTLADAIEDLANSQKALKDFTLQNSVKSKEGYISGSLLLDQLRAELREAEEFFSLVEKIKKEIEIGTLDDEVYEKLKKSNPLIDDVRFRRIVGLSETINSWDWPTLQTIEAVSDTLSDRIQQLNSEIVQTENETKFYATSADKIEVLERDAKLAEATYTVMIEQVKSQTLAAGFIVDAFKVFEFATPPLTPSAPRRNFILVLSGLLGLALGSMIAVTYAILRDTYYTLSMLLKESQSRLSASSRKLRKLSHQPVEKINEVLHKVSYPDIDEAIAELSNNKLSVIFNSKNRCSTKGFAAILALKLAMSDRKIALIDVSEKLTKQAQHKTSLKVPIRNSSGFVEIISKFDENENFGNYSSPRYSSLLKDLLDNYDHIMFVSTLSKSTSILLFLEKFNPLVILLGKVKKTKKQFIKKIVRIHRVGILFHG